MTDVDEMAGGIRAFDRTEANPELVVARGNVFWIGVNVKALNPPRKLQVGTPIVVRKLGVVLHVTVISPVGAI